MNPRRYVLTGWLLLGSLAALSQGAKSEKHDFAYKTVDGHAVMATIYVPESDRKVPVLVYFHGGGFIFGNRLEGLESALRDKLLENKIAVVSADYRLAPETKLGEIIRDACDVVKWIKTHGADKFGIDTCRVAAGGGSAGGYLAFTTGFDAQHAPDAVVAISAPTGFLTEGIMPADLSRAAAIEKGPVISHGDYTTRMDLWRELGWKGLALYEIFGFDPATEPQKLTPYTLTANIGPGYPPTLLLHARKDRLVRVQEVELFYKFMKNNTIDAELYLVEEGHDSELIRTNPDAVDAVVTFLNERLGK
ncbi:alpha/beta hydrolase [uncultured Alistipes sp.]|jgi:putative lipase/esterase|uniref:alpha/beta hydrolase n=1 Tax=uncultured Alistipes sp. TaxID=538949 RepID=UPI0025F898E0|nr:alpha/beta hydrolase [uncultured Alistipes sp.]